jgi:hypothetical protein
MTLEEAIEASIGRTIDERGLMFVGGTSIAEAVREWARENADELFYWNDFGEWVDCTEAVPLDKFGGEG